MGSITFSFLKVREAAQKQNVPKKWETSKGGAAVPLIKSSNLTLLGCKFEQDKIK